MNPLRRIGAAVDSIWASIDPDEPLFCDCHGSRWCADCALGAPMDCVPDWSVTAPAAAAR